MQVALLVGMPVGTCGGVQGVQCVGVVLGASGDQWQGHRGH